MAPKQVTSGATTTNYSGLSRGRITTHCISTIAIKTLHNHAYRRNFSDCNLYQLGNTKMRATLKTKGTKPIPSNVSNRPQLLERMALRHFHSSDWDKALKLLRQAHSLAPQNHSICNNIGVAFWGKKSYKKARHWFSKAISLAPQTTSYIGNFVRSVIETEGSTAAVSQAITLLHGKAHTHKHALGAIVDYLVQREEPQLALTLLSKLHDCPESDPDILFLWTTAYKATNQIDKAMELANHGLSAHPDHIPLLLRRSELFFHLELPAEAERDARRAIELSETNANAYLALGNALIKQNRVQEAIKNYETAININPSLGSAQWNLSLALLLAGRFKEGWAKYHWGISQKKRDVPAVSLPAWDGSTVPQKTILVRHEQGFGDVIQFVRFLPLVRKRCASLLFVCQKGLIPLLEKFPGVDEIFSDTNEALQKADYFVPLLDIPKFILSDENDIPSRSGYIEPPRNYKCKWQPFFSSIKGLKIGVVWAGNPNHTNDKNRSIHFQIFQKIFYDKNIFVFSLQKGSAAKDACNFKPGSTIFLDLGPYIEDFADTSAIIKHLDLVICVDTSVAHLAGAMGKQVWTLLPFAPDWRWQLDREDTPWYNSMKLYRQPAPGDWDSVIKQVENDLQEIIKTTKGHTNVDIQLFHQATDGYTQLVTDFCRALRAGNRYLTEAVLFEVKVLQNRGLAVEAAALLRESLRALPENTDLLLALGGVLLTLNEYGDALDSFQTAISIDPTNSDNMMWIAVALVKHGHFNIAADILDVVRTLDPNKYEKCRKMRRVIDRLIGSS
ncbi:MAG: tetratricopeptide repeat protein [Gammaproteobacteria bacterium]|nr:MAG: tetratricopeptide repeat protein [Gammaproteobacteria bacterium]